MAADSILPMSDPWVIAATAVYGLSFLISVAFSIFLFVRRADLTTEQLQHYQFRWTMSLITLTATWCTTVQCRAMHAFNQREVVSSCALLPTHSGEKSVCDINRYTDSPITSGLMYFSAAIYVAATLRVVTLRLSFGAMGKVVTDSTEAHDVVKTKTTTATDEDGNELWSTTREISRRFVPGWSESDNSTELAKNFATFMAFSYPLGTGGFSVLMESFDANSLCWYIATPSTIRTWAAASGIITAVFAIISFMVFKGAHAGGVAQRHTKALGVFVAHLLIVSGIGLYLRGVNMHALTARDASTMFAVRQFFLYSAPPSIAVLFQLLCLAVVHFACGVGKLAEGNAEQNSGGSRHEERRERAQPKQPKVGRKQRKRERREAADREMQEALLRNESSGAASTVMQPMHQPSFSVQQPPQYGQYPPQQRQQLQYAPAVQHQQYYAPGAQPGWQQYGPPPPQQQPYYPPMQQTYPGQQVHVYPQGPSY